CHARTSEIIDSLVELLIQLVFKIDTKAEKRVEKELTADLKRVTGKTGSCTGWPRRRWRIRTKRYVR
ncbi:MAG: hypothetical protein WAK86_12185, partial [Pseudonocardiaceae bacterium]